MTIKMGPWCKLTNSGRKLHVSGRKNEQPKRLSIERDRETQKMKLMMFSYSSVPSVHFLPAGRLCSRMCKQKQQP